MPLIYSSMETSVLGTETHPSLTQGKSVGDCFGLITSEAGHCKVLLSLQK